jgi:hypothetical protein
MNRQQVYNVVPLTVAPSFNIQFITFCIMYVSFPSFQLPTFVSEPHQWNGAVPRDVCFKAECVCGERCFGSSRHPPPPNTRPLVAYNSLKAGWTNKVSLGPDCTPQPVMWHTSSSCLYPQLTAERKCVYTHIRSRTPLCCIYSETSAAVAGNSGTSI